VAFFAIAVATLLRPLWQAAGRRGIVLLACPAAVAALAVSAFPLAPAPPADAVTWIVAALAGGAACAAALWRTPERIRTGAGAMATGALLLLLILALPHSPRHGKRCPQTPAIRYFQSLPKDAIVAGDPQNLTCVGVSAERAVVISAKLAPSYEAAAFRDGRARMFADLRAVYAPSPDAITELRTRYGATHLWIRRHAVARGAGWRPRRLPYGRFVPDLLRTGEPATLRLPAACRKWRHGSAEVYDIACISHTRRSPGADEPAHRRGS
jgi:hypothetical protein